MSASVVIVDAHEGSLSRYEIGAETPRKTHACAAGPEIPRPLTFTTDVVEDFRRFPPGDFYVGPPAPVPGGDRPGGSPVAARAA